MIERLRSQWQEGMSCAALIELRDELDTMLQRIRSDGHIRRAVFRCPKCRHVGQGAEPHRKQKGLDLYWVVSSVPVTGGWPHPIYPIGASCWYRAGCCAKRLDGEWPHGCVSEYHRGRAGERFEDDPSVRDERHEKAEHTAHDGVSPYLTCTQMNTRLSIARTVAATTVSVGCQWKAAGTISPTVQTSSRMPRDIRADLVEHEDFHDARRSVCERGKALKEPTTGCSSRHGAVIASFLRRKAWWRPASSMTPIGAR